MKLTTLKIKTYFVINLISYSTTVNYNCAENLSVNYVMEQILIKERPHQVMLFFNDSLISHVTNEILHFVKIPSFKMEPRNLIFENHISSKVTYLMHVSVIVICINYLNEAYKYIDFIVQQVPVYPRPKCLILLYGQKYSQSLEIEKILKFAWANKILDFSIFIIGTFKNTTLVYDYNPFNSSTMKQTCKPNFQVFPEKLKTINNYPLNVTFSSANLIAKSKLSPELNVFTKVDFTVRFMLKNMKFYLRPVEGDNKPLDTKFRLSERDISWFTKFYSNVHGIMLGPRYISGCTNISDLIILPSQQFYFGFVAIVYL